MCLVNNRAENRRGICQKISIFCFSFLLDIYHCYEYPRFSVAPQPHRITSGSHCDPVESALVGDSAFIFKKRNHLTLTHFWFGHSTSNQTEICFLLPRRINNGRAAFVRTPCLYFIDVFVCADFGRLRWYGDGDLYRQSIRRTVSSRARIFLSLLGGGRSQKEICKKRRKREIRTKVCKLLQAFISLVCDYY